jgi:hypothetical protein
MKLMAKTLNFEQIEAIKRINSSDSEKGSLSSGSDLIKEISS